MLRYVLAFATVMVAAPASAETVCVKYGQCPLDLATFECTDVTRSSLVGRVCHDADQKFMVVLLRNTYYPYCDIDADMVASFLDAPSMGRFYNQNIRSKRDGTQGPFDCRDHPMPQY